jgi:endonuclease/exonuclease/phosphatase family metal-dependent hydrolase
MGEVQSGIETITGLAVESAERISLPTPFSWPLRGCEPQALSAGELHQPADSDAQLVVVNLHLEAYDDGTGKAAQTKMLYDFIEAEYEKGNYVICGGDF